jgi:hypothetical protein
LDLAMQILDVYVRYPLSEELVPYNYCALPRLFPSLKDFFALFCN